MRVENSLREKFFRNLPADFLRGPLVCSEAHSVWLAVWLYSREGCKNKDLALSSSRPRFLSSRKRSG